MLPIIHHPGTRAICFRQTTKQLTGSGSLFDAAIQLYQKVDKKLKINVKDTYLKFSSGAVLQFAYLDKPADKYNYQGKEYSRILLDEAQQLDGESVFYVLGRLRSTIVDYPLQAFATCNPDPDSWLMQFVEHSLDENLVPVKKEFYDKRYFVRSPQGTQFFDKLEDAQAIYGTSKENGVKSYKFVPGTIYDNPAGLKLNEGYISTLKAQQSHTEVLRLLHGAWVRAQNSGYFKREWVDFVQIPNLKARRRVRAWDLAASKPSEANPRVDATAGVLISKDKENLYTVEDVKKIRERIHEVEKLIFQTAKEDGTDVIISIPLDPGATASAYCKDLARRLGEMGYTVKLVRPEKGKLQRFLPFASVAEAGFVNIVQGSWTEDYIQELESTTFGKGTFDDQADATSDAFYVLNRTVHIPEFKLPNMERANPFSIGFD